MKTPRGRRAPEFWRRIAALRKRPWRAARVIGWGFLFRYLMRAMTLDGLYLFLDITRQTFDNYRERDDFFTVTMQIEATIRSQKFAGAAADLLNANIIARDLGLSDKRELSGVDGGPIRQSDG